MQKDQLQSWSWTGIFKTELLAEQSGKIIILVTEFFPFWYGTLLNPGTRELHNESRDVVLPAQQLCSLYVQWCEGQSLGRLVGWLLNYYEETPPQYKIYVQFLRSATSDEEGMEKCHYREEDYYD